MKNKERKELGSTKSNNFLGEFFWFIECWWWCWWTQLEMLIILLMLMMIMMMGLKRNIKIFFEHHHPLFIIFFLFICIPSYVYSTIFFLWFSNMLPLDWILYIYTTTAWWEHILIWVITIYHADGPDHIQTSRANRPWHQHHTTRHLCIHRWIICVVPYSDVFSVLFWLKNVNDDDDEQAKRKKWKRSHGQDNSSSRSRSRTVNNNNNSSSSRTDEPPTRTTISTRINRWNCISEKIISLNRLSIYVYTVYRRN